MGAILAERIVEAKEVSYEGEMLELAMRKHVLHSVLDQRSYDIELSVKLLKLHPYRVTAIHTQIGHFSFRCRIGSPDNQKSTKTSK